MRDRGGFVPLIVPVSYPNKIPPNATNKPILVSPVGTSRRLSSSVPIIIAGAEEPATLSGFLSTFGNKINAIAPELVQFVRVFADHQASSGSIALSSSIGIVAIPRRTPIWLLAPPWLCFLG